MTILIAYNNRSTPATITIPPGVLNNTEFPLVVTIQPGKQFECAVRHDCREAIARAIGDDVKFSLVLP